MGFGMAVGIILIDLSPSYNTDLMAYLFGSILAVGTQDLWLMALVDSVVVLLILLFYRQFEALSFDAELQKFVVSIQVFSLSFNRPYGFLHSYFHTPCRAYFSYGFT